MQRLRTWLAKREFGRLFRNAAFTRLFAGRIVTDAGDSLYYIASMWLVWELTGSAFYTGLAGALLQVPNALSFAVGPLVDRWDLRRLLLGTQLINGVGVLVVPIVALLGHLSVWWLLLLMPILDFVNGFVYPAQNAALPKLVETDQLTRANSLFSASVRTVGLLTNAVGGALIALVGAVSLFVVNAATFAIAAVLFLGVRVPNRMGSDDLPADDGSDTSYFTELREGIGYVRGSALSAMLVGMMLGNLTAIAANVVLPAFADSLAGPTAYGILLAAMGAGGLIGSSLAFLVEGYSVSRIAVGANLLSGIAWVGAIAVPGVWPTAALLFAATVPTGTFNVVYGSMYQTAVDDALLGRVSALTRTLSSAMMPAGALLGGVVADIIGAATVLYAVGGSTLFVSLYYLLHPRLRSLPAVRETDETALGL